ncbi:MAG: ATP-dependent Clp protease adaptor ClpS [Verrucomicrobiota bacterium]|nr:ATP-dependent Clp protease adaptor ClpS [Verrucomicrobiota bacterium]
MVSLIGGGGTTAPETVVESKTDLSGLWNVIVLNDPVNLMSYVTMVFKRVLGMEQSEAEQRMMEVHELGRSVVWTGDREKAEAYQYQLQEWHLTAILEKNESSA